MALSTGGFLFACPNRAGRSGNPDRAVGRGKKSGKCARPPGLCTLRASRLGKAKEAASMHPRAPDLGESCTLRPPPLHTHFRTPGRVEESCSRGRGRRSTAPHGEGAPGSAGSAPRPRRKGRGGGGRRGPSQTRRQERRGRPAGDPAAPSGWELASRQRGHVCGPSSRACLPRALGPPFINSSPAQRLPSAGASRERLAAARPPPMGRASRR